MTEQDRGEPLRESPRGELVPAEAAGSMREWAEQLVARAREDGVALTGEGGLLTDLMRHVLQTGLEVEMAEHLGYERGEAPPGGMGNARNGGYGKTVTTEIGEVELRIPRDRRGTFEPTLVPKYQRRLDGLAGNVISLYAKGLTTGDIQQHLLEIYGTEVSRETISKITDQIVDEMAAWQSRPLDPLYAVLLIDCLVIKVRGSQVANRPVYVAIGVNLDGGAGRARALARTFGLGGCQAVGDDVDRVRNRGLADALIVCCDGLKGLPDSIRLTWPQATVQTCVVHMVRNSLRYASKKHWSKITTAMRGIYTAPTLEAAEARFAEFAGEWEQAYPAMIGAWRSVWTEFVPFLEFPAELRKLVYTTDEIVNSARLVGGAASGRP
jgi:transposase-like protein